MDFDRLTTVAQNALKSARDRARAQGQQQVDVEHLLAALLEAAGRRTFDLLQSAGVDGDELAKRALREVGRLPKVSGTSEDSDKIYLTSRLNRVLNRAVEEADKAKDQFVAPEHLFLGMIEDEGETGRLLRQSGLTREKLLNAMKEIRKGENVNTQDPEATYKALEQFGRDLTEMA